MELKLLIDNSSRHTKRNRQQTAQQYFYC